MPWWSVTVTAEGRVVGTAEIEVEAASEKQAREKAKMQARMLKAFEPDDAGVEWMGPYGVDSVLFLPHHKGTKP